MRRRESSISKASSYKEIAEFWDTHDTTDFLEQTKQVPMSFAVDTEVTYYAVDNKLADRILKAAKKHGVSSDTLVNMWVQGKLEEEKVY